MNTHVMKTAEAARNPRTITALDCFLETRSPETAPPCPCPPVPRPYAMMAPVAQFPFVPAGDLRELGDDIRELFADIEAQLPPDKRVYSGECHPVLDVLETSTGVEIIFDITGVQADALRVLFRDGVVLVAGAKAPSNPAGTYHLVEREFGRFARAVRLTGAFDASAARASLENGELTIVIPRRTERRGRPHAVPIVSTGDRHPA